MAQRMEPDNIYITAIVERIHRLAAESSNGGRFLAITVGNEFDEGIKPGPATPLPAEDIDAQIRKLTARAQELVRRGAYETAFDSLMNAYFLDPVSPTPMESEKTLIPAIEMLRRQKGKEGSERMNGLVMLPPSGRKPDSTNLSAQDSQRIEELRRQKEVERLEKERAIWREASRLPKILEDVLVPLPRDEDQAEPPAAGEPPKETGGFFTKLRRGKLLG